MEKQARDEMGDRLYQAQYRNEMRLRTTIIITLLLGLYFIAIWRIYRDVFLPEKICVMTSLTATTSNNGVNHVD